MKYLLTVLLYSFFYTASAQVNLNQGLIAYYSFNGTANDVSGKNNNPSYNSATLTTDRYGNANSACYFDGIDDYITVPGAAGMNTATAMTVAMYFNTESTSLQTLIGKIGYTTGTGAQFQVAINWTTYPGILYGVNNPADLCNTQIATNSAYVNTGGTVPTNQWHCLVCTYEGGVQKLYLNGLLVSTNNTSFNVLRQCTNSDIQIGNWWQNGQQLFKGKMDDVRIYNRALNQTEVNALCLANLVPVTASFTAPDTVCVNTPVTITNTSTNATTNYWNFCTGNLNAPPIGNNLGNLNSSITSPVFIDYVEENGNYYGFMTNNQPGRLFRLDFGNSLLNTPFVTDLGNLGIPNAGEGIQVVKNEGKWYAIIVGGTAANSTQPCIIKVEFGANITNNAPVSTNWGNIGNLAYPHDLYMFVDNAGVWHGLTVNSDNNTITRFNFTNSFSNTPTAANLGNIGNLNGPTGICAINDNGNWYAFVANATGNTLTRLDFGNSLFNIPTGTNLGNIGNVFHAPWDIQVIKYCGELIGYIINANQSYNDLIKLNFTNITSTPAATSFGNIGNMSFPHCLSKFFRAGADLYTFTPNVANQTLTRLRFAGCTSASTPNSTSANPGSVTYNTPGTYNITLTIDDGLPTQTTVCKQVVVLPVPAKTPTQAITLCGGQSKKIGTGEKNAQYTWNTGATTDSIVVNTPGTYWVQMDNFGCSNRDSMEITVIPAPVVDLGPDAKWCIPPNMVLDAGNSGASFLWQDGSTAQTFTVTTYGKYYVRVTSANGCVSSDTITLSQVTTAPFDFTYKQDICDPHTVLFTAAGSNAANTYWAFGDGNTTTGSLTASNTYTGYANYTVRFANESNGCKDTITKLISIDVTQSDLVPTPDTTICFNTTKQLRAQKALNFCWSPTTWLNNPNTQNPVTSTTEKITYYYTAEVTGANIITNGDFNNGNSGFTSDYTYANTNVAEGQYYVGASPQTWNPSFSNCTDHTTGTGNMLLVNGTSVADVNVWSTTVAVTPNTNYAFGTWVQALNLTNPAQLSFSFNGVQQGAPVNASLPTCTWSQFYTTWNSGSNTSVSIAIVNRNTQVTGNDLALDDISFAPVYIQRDSVIISIDTPIVFTRTDTTICKNEQVQLQASGAATYTWTPAAGLSNTAISNPVATPAVNTAYIVTATNSNGCAVKDTININLYAKPTVITDHEVTACPNVPVQLSANTNMTSWLWTPALYLSNTAIANPITTPAKNLTYTVQVKDPNNCIYTDTVHVQLYDTRFALFGLNPTICEGAAVNLQASGGDSWLWSPAGSLSDATIANPVATPDTTTMYTVVAKESTCGKDSTMYVQVKVNPTPVIAVTKENDLNCVVHTTKLHVSGTAGTSYVWSPVTSLDHPNLPDPVSSPDTTTRYYVTGLNQYGCTAIDSVTVYVEAEGKVTFMVPNAFTPNNDGRNDCFGVKSWGGATIEEFSVFNRYGQRVFSAKNASACWNGRFNGELQPAGGYVYVITAKTFCGNIKRTGTVMLIR